MAGFEDAVPDGGDPRVGSTWGRGAESIGWVDASDTRGFAMLEGRLGAVVGRGLTVESKTAKL